MQEYLDYFNQSKNKDIIYINTLIKSKAIDKNIPVLICGYTGTGKEIVAKLIHYHSSRSQNILVTVNCSQIPETLFDSQMFGYLKGSYTGADKSTKGYFGMAHEGTLYLDEVDSLPKSFQVKLLRALENKQFYRVGASKPTSVDVNIITSFSKYTEETLAKEIIREDLFYRLAGVVLRLPRLRDRTRDLNWFINFYCQIYSKKYNKTIKFTESALRYLNTYSWPGNIRELKSLIERLFILETKIKIDKIILRSNLLIFSHTDIISNFSLAKSEDRLIISALSKTDNNQRNAAVLLGISSRALNYKVQALRRKGHNI